MVNFVRPFEKEGVASEVNDFKLHALQIIIIKNNLFLAAESSGWGFGWGGGGGTDEFVESFVPADNKTYEGPEF